MIKTFTAGKRKASVIEGTESPRDKKRARDDSEPAEEDDPGQYPPDSPVPSTLIDTSRPKCEHFTHPSPW